MSKIVKQKNGGDMSNNVDCGLSYDNHSVWYRGSGKALSELAPWIVVCVAIVGLVIIAVRAISGG